MSPLGATRAAILGASGGGAGAGAFATVVGSFTKINTTTTQQITGVGFTPKAIMLWTSGSNAAAGTFNSHILQTIGITSGPTESYAISAQSRDGSSGSTSRVVSAHVLRINDPASAITVKVSADLLSFDNDGFTLDWTVNTSGIYADMTIMFMAIGGDDVSAKAVNWTTPTTTGNKVVTGVGFQPSAVVHLGQSGMSGTLPDAQTGTYPAFSAMDSAGGQWAFGHTSIHTNSTTDTARILLTSRCLVHLASTTGTYEEAAYASMNADGFTVTFSKAAAVAAHVFSLCLSGVSADVGNFLGPTVASSTAITGVGFEPSAVLLATNSNTSTSNITGHNVFGLGASDGVTSRTAGHFDLDNQANAQADSVWLSKAIAAPGSPPQTVEEADLQSFDTDGFTLNFTKANGGIVHYAYLALGSL